MGRVDDYFLQAANGVYSSPTICFLDKSKVSVWGKFGVSREHKRDGYMSLFSSKNSPTKILHGSIILILTDAVVSMEIDARTMMGGLVLQEVMDKTDGGVGIDEIVELPV